MHLDPITEEISTKISDDSSTSKTPYSFINEMLAKRNHGDGASIRAKLTALASGEVVILNDIPNLFLEIREGDFIGHIGLKGFYVADARRVLHLEIFSATNIVQGIADFKTELDISGVKNPLDREEVFKTVKEPLFCDYKENLCYYDYDGISPKEIEGFFRHHASHATRAITLIAKVVVDGVTDLAQNISDSVGIWTGAGEDTEEFVKRNIKPYLWWNSEITTALDGLSANSAVYYYHPIHFLHWLMTNDEELYAKICPIMEGNEITDALGLL